MSHSSKVIVLLGNLRLFLKIIDVNLPLIIVYLWDKFVPLFVRGEDGAGQGCQ